MDIFHITDSPAEVVEIVRRAQSSLSELDADISNRDSEFQSLKAISDKDRIRGHGNCDDLRCARNCEAPALRARARRIFLRVVLASNKISAAALDLSLPTINRFHLRQDLNTRCEMRTNQHVGKPRRLLAVRSRHENYNRVTNIFGRHSITLLPRPRPQLIRRLTAWYRYRRTHRKLPSLDRSHVHRQKSLRPQPSQTTTARGHP